MYKFLKESIISFITEPVDLLKVIPQVGSVRLRIAVEYICDSMSVWPRQQLTILLFYIRFYASVSFAKTNWY